MIKRGWKKGFIAPQREKESRSTSSLPRDQRQPVSPFWRSKSLEVDRLIGAGGETVQAAGAKTDIDQRPFLTETVGLFRLQTQRVAGAGSDAAAASRAVFFDGGYLHRIKWRKGKALSFVLSRCSLRLSDVRLSPRGKDHCLLPFLLITLEQNHPQSQARNGAAGRNGGVVAMWKGC